MPKMSVMQAVYLRMATYTAAPPEDKKTLRSVRVKVDRDIPVEELGIVWQGAGMRMAEGTVEMLIAKQVELGLSARDLTTLETAYKATPYNTPTDGLETECLALLKLLPVWQRQAKAKEDVDKLSPEDKRALLKANK